MKGLIMETCTFFDFMEILKPWIDRDYIRKGFLGTDGTFRIYFTDGGEKTYQVADCSADRLLKTFDLLAAAGIPVEKGA